MFGLKESFILKKPIICFNNCREGWKKMNKKIYYTGIGFIVVGIILIIFGYIFTGDFVYRNFKSNIFNTYPISPIIILLGVLLFISGVVFSIFGKKI